MSTGAHLLRGSLFRTLDLLALVGASFILTPYLVHSLGSRIYGFWMIVGSLMGYYGVMEFGMSTAASRYMAQALGQGDSRALDTVASTALLMFCGVAVLALLVTALGVAACPYVVKDASDSAMFQRLLVIMGVATAATFVSRTFMSILASGIRYDLIAVISIARTLAVNVGIYAVLRARLGIVAVALTTMAVGLLQCAGLYAASRAQFPKLNLSPWLATKAMRRELVSYSSKSFACHLGDLLRFRMDSLIIAGFLGASLVTPYAIGGRLVEGFSSLVLGSVGMMLPVFSRYHGRGDFDGMRDSLIKVTKLSTMLTVFVGASLLFYGRAFIERWMGPGFEASYIVAAILTVGYLLDLPQSPGIQLLYGLSKQEVYAVLNFCEGILAVVLSLLFLKRWGIYGVAVGIASAFGLFKLLIQPFYVCRAVGVTARVYLFESIIAPLVKTAVPLGLFFFAIRRLVAPSYAVLAGCGALQAALFAPFAYFLIMGPPERQAVTGALRAMGLSAAEAAGG